MSSWRIHTDGGARGNPGPAAIGVVVFDEQNQVRYETGLTIGETTNNEAEYQAFLASLEWVVKSGDLPQALTWKLDSKLVVEQLNRRWKIKEPRLRTYAERAWQLLKQLPSSIQVSIEHVRREANADADALVNQALDAAGF